MASEKDEKKATPPTESPEAIAAKERVEAEKAHALAVADGSKVKAGFVIAKGISVTCARGVIEENHPIAPTDFGVGDKGKAAFDDLVARGAIVKS